MNEETERQFQKWFGLYLKSDLDLYSKEDCAGLAWFDCKKLHQAKIDRLEKELSAYRLKCNRDNELNGLSRQDDSFRGIYANKDFS